MSPITEFYRGKSILVTGGSGFMGKVLLEKLLRSLPEIKQIFVLLRSNENMSSSERLRDITSKPPFTLHLGENDICKLVAISGDIGQENLGLSDKDRDMLISEVSVVFHLAASLQMNLSLKEAIKQNTVSTLKLLTLCRAMKNLMSVVHLSTAYCNIPEEKIQHSESNPLKIIDFVQRMDEEVLNKIQDSIIKPHPNTYTYTKRLAEIIALNMGKTLPISICRPSIVTPALIEPTPGWVDNPNGAIGLILATGKGALRSLIMDSNSIPQIIPVDIAINNMIVCGWYRTTFQFDETPTFNLTQGNISKATWGDICERVKEIAVQYPYKHFFWYPVCKGTTFRWYHNTMVLLFHMLPAYVIDFFRFLFMKKVFVVRLQQKLTTVMNTLEPFTIKTWHFSTTELMKMKSVLSSEDLETFYFLEKSFDMNSYLLDCVLGARQFYIHESWNDLFYDRIVLYIMFCVEYLGRGFIGYGVIWLIFHMFNASGLLSLGYWKNKLHIFHNLKHFKPLFAVSS